MTDPGVAGVLHVIASTDRRGAEVFAHDLVGALERIGRSGELIAVAPGRTSARFEVEDVGGLNPAGVRRLWRRARHHELLVAHGSITLPASAAATIGGPPFVYRSIGDPRFWSSSRLTAARVRPLLSRAAAVVALWPAAADHLVERGIRSRVVVIPNAVDTAHYRPPTSVERAEARSALGVDGDLDVVLYLGSLSPEKDPVSAVEACAGMARACLVVAGDGPLRTELEARSSASVHVVGPVEDARRLLWAADVLVIPSLSEGIPAVAIEAGACGLAVVATDVGGVSSVVLDGRTGRLVEPGDVAALRAGVEEALEGRFDPALARQHCVAEFDLSAVAEQWDALIGSFVG